MSCGGVKVRKNRHKVNNIDSTIFVIYNLHIPQNATLTSTIIKKGSESAQESSCSLQCVNVLIYKLSIPQNVELTSTVRKKGSESLHM